MSFFLFRMTQTSIFLYFSTSAFSPSSLVKQQALYSLPLPQEQGSLRRRLELPADLNFQKCELIFKKFDYFPYTEELLGKYSPPDDLKYIAAVQSPLMTYAESSKGTCRPPAIYRNCAAINCVLTGNNDINERHNFFLLDQPTLAAIINTSPQRVFLPMGTL